jgi:two-component system NtrC family sensor kinase
MNSAEACQTKGSGQVVLNGEADLKRGTMVIRISDNGEGMTPEIAAMIFDPFFTTKEEGKGVGLGLAVVYGIVEAHRGTLDVKSAVGGGTTVTIELPLVALQTEGVEAEPSDLRV